MLSQKFLGINQLYHRFPEEVRYLDIQLTLLHNHPHAPSNFYLVFLNDFKKAIYLPEEDIKDKYYPCSFYLENGKPRVYQFSDEKLEFDQAKVENDLKLIESKGYLHYGTTIRPIREQSEFETETGHIYVPSKSRIGKPILKYSQTAISGTKMNGCYVKCEQTSHCTHLQQHVECRP